MRRDAAWGTSEEANSEHGHMQTQHGHMQTLPSVREGMNLIGGGAEVNASVV
jgi:hypothetical protein